MSHVHARGCLCSRSCGGRRKRRASTTLGRVPGRRRHHRAGGAPGGAVAHGDGVSHTPQAECNCIRTCSWTRPHCTPSLHAGRACSRGAATQSCRGMRAESGCACFSPRCFMFFPIYSYVYGRQAFLPSPRAARLLVEEVLVARGPADELGGREPEGDLVLGRLHGVGAVADVAAPRHGGGKASGRRAGESARCATTSRRCLPPHAAPKASPPPTQHQEHGKEHGGPRRKLCVIL